MTRLAAVKFVLFQIVWLCCALGAAHGWSAPGIGSALVLVAVHLATATLRLQAVLTTLVAGCFGFVAESLLLVADLVRYATPWPAQGLAPAWLVALWLAFASTFEPTRRMLGPGAVALSGLLGLVLGPVSYIAGERLGALAFSQPAWRGWLAVSLVWGVAYATLIALDQRLEAQLLRRRNLQS